MQHVASSGTVSSLQLPLSPPTLHRAILTYLSSLKSMGLQRKVSGSDEGEYKGGSLLDCFAVMSGEILMSFRNACCLHHQGDEYSQAS
jgi:hypothetical protein